jgi:hypothetical protein
MLTAPWGTRQVKGPTRPFSQTVLITGTVTRIVEKGTGTLSIADQVLIAG